MENKISKCNFCKEIADIKKEDNPFFVAELETGYVVMSWYQYFKGYTIFILKSHSTELHKLKSDLRDKFLCEMSLVAEAVYRAFKPKRLNYAKLGNGDPHLHWHIIPRYGTDPKPGNTIWAISKRIWQSDKQRPAPEKLNVLKRKLKKEMEYLLRGKKYKKCHGK
jgi:diadenosine tetraphosphate (Ap4A) HIT family hydrolase